MGTSKEGGAIPTTRWLCPLMSMFLPIRVGSAPYRRRHKASLITTTHPADEPRHPPLRRHPRRNSPLPQGRGGGSSSCFRTTALNPSDPVSVCLCRLQRLPRRYQFDPRDGSETPLTAQWPSRALPSRIPLQPGFQELMVLARPIGAPQVALVCDRLFGGRAYRVLARVGYYALRRGQKNIAARSFSTTP